ncbi:MAG: nucleotidyltransferase [Anaerolineae bacterium]|nr:nucleotidyltransferase [Anaerolineae bacterium]MDK1119539.1 nucleotidyltransferase [Anaerolineae bacterium]
MKLPADVEPLFGPLDALQRLLSKFDERGVIIGGIAASLLGKPRYTADVDAMFLLSTGEIQRFLEMAKKEGIEPRIEAAVDFAKKNRVLLLRHVSSETNVDISLGILPFEEEIVERSTVHKFDTLQLRIPTPEDLIILKAVAHRPKDLQDIREIFDRQPNLDLPRIENWVKAFAKALEMPNLWGQIEALLKE